MSRLWAVTSFFNPAGYHLRLPNYHKFREALGIPLATVELSFDGSYALKASDADILLQLRGDDVMWQKERILNRLLDELPDECDLVAWIDCDVIFESETWVQATMDELENQRLVHLYDRRLNLGRDLRVEDVLVDDPSNYDEFDTPSAVYLLNQGSSSADDFRRAETPVDKRSTVGLAWASTRDILTRHGLYDGCVVGGADRVIASAAIGRFDFGIEAVKMTPARERHFLAWARPFYDSIQARVTCIPGRAIHLWHGDLQDRQYMKRHYILNENDFDPMVDIELDPEGVWKWATDKPRLHKAVCDYFSNRKEDG